MANTDRFRLVGKPGTATTLSAPGHTSGGTSITVGSTTNWPTTTGVTFAIDRVTVSGSTETQVAGSYTIWVGDVTGATTIANMVLDADSPNSDQDYPAGSTTRVYIPVSVATHNDMINGILVHADQDGTLKAGAVDVTAVLADSIVTKAKLGATLTTELNDSWITGVLPAVSSVTYNGNGSETITFGSSVASTLSPGMRLRTTRTASAPTQCTDLEASSSQYFSSASAGLAGMAFTDDFTCMAWVKLESYPGSAGGIISRSGASTNGYDLRINSSGQLIIRGQAAGPTDRTATTYQSVPLGRWVHVAATLDMSANTATMYINGVLVPSTTSGTATALVQGGDLNVGAITATAYHDGKIAQVAVFSSVLSASTIRSYMSQGLSGSESTLVSAFSCNNSLLDLNTTNNNDLTANGGALMTNSDSPFANATGTPSGTTDVALVMSVSGSTATVQVPEGCTIPTSGGVSAVAYSTTANPYGWVADKGRWEVSFTSKVQLNTAAVGANVVTNIGSTQFALPVGSWGDFGFDFGGQITHAGVAFLNQALALSTSSSTVSDYELMSVSPSVSSSITEIDSRFSRRKPMTVTSATVYYLLSFSTNATTTQYINGNTAFGANRIFAIPAGI